ncbi:unnamed protein product [Schistosoma rodhaini]|nr:unnamed protein product [Schistosoma rodhaini]
MDEDTDFLMHVGIVNRECERFRLKSLTEDQFKALILICSLQSQKFSNIRTRLFSRLDEDPKLTLNDIANEYQRLINLQHDTIMVQRGVSDRPEVHVVQQPTKPVKSAPAKPSSSHSNSVQQAKTNPPAPCWQCGAWHNIQSCPYKQHCCRNCKAVGHKDGFCQNTKPNSPRSTRKSASNPCTNSLSFVETCQNSTPGERKFITINISGHPFRLQIDTASDLTILSQFHIDHPGIKRMKSIARSYAYWPLMEQHIVDLVNKCAQCQQAAKSNAKVPPVPRPQPEHPWSRIHVDFAGPVSWVASE